MYKKILNINSQATGGLNKAENATSTITLKDLKTPSPTSSAINVHQQPEQQQTNTNETLDVDVNDESAPSSFAIENVVNGSDKVIYETPYERPLASSIPSTSPSHHVSSLSPPPPPPSTKMESDDYHSEHTTYPTHKSIHHTATIVAYRDMMVDENLENKQQNFVNEEDDVWRPW